MTFKSKLLINKYISKENMVIIQHALCPAVHRRGRGGDQISPYNKSFLLCHHFPIQYITQSPTSSITVPILHPHIFQTAMQPYPPCTLFHIPPATFQPLQFSSPHSPVPTNPSQIPHASPINIILAF